MGKRIKFVAADITYEQGSDTIEYKLVDGKKVYKTEVYSRVCGYLSPVSGWNKGKKSEWDDRKEYKERKSANRGGEKFE